MAKAPPAKPAAPAASGRKVHWNTETMKNTYANVCNVTGTREEVVFLFGVNQSWEPDQETLEIELTDRIIMSPFAARRLNQQLTGLLDAYETRHGPLAAAPAAEDGSG